MKLRAKLKNLKTEDELTSDDRKRLRKESKSKAKKRAKLNPNKSDMESYRSVQKILEKDKRVTMA